LAKAKADSRIRNTEILRREIMQILRIIFLVVSSLLLNLRGIADPVEQWQEIKPKGATRCARGDDFSFFVRQGSSKKILVNFMGGGACWDDKSCKPGSKLFVDTVEKTKKLVLGQQVGVFDSNNSKNPFKDYTQVVIPSCTGDIHWGDNEVEYMNNGDSYVIHHKGAVNTNSVMNYLEDQHQEVEKVFVTGCSAGAYGSIYWLPKLKEIYSESEIRQFGDSGAGVIGRNFRRDFMPNWQTESYAPSWIPSLDPQKINWYDLTILDFYKNIVDYYPEISFSQFSHSSDLIQTFFYKISGGRALAWKRQMKDYLKELDDYSDRFSSYIDTGAGHCATNNENFYKIKHKGVYLHQWLQNIAH
jgi:hypothetical protein